MLFGITTKIEQKSARLSRKLDRALKAVKKTRSEEVIGKARVVRGQKLRVLTKDSKPAPAPSVTTEEYESRCRTLIERLRHSLAARYLNTESLRSQYLRAGIYSLIRSHAKEPITNGKMVPLIDHERDIRHFEALPSAQERWRRLVVKCADLGVRTAI